jgi:O-antigen ligase
MRPSSRRRRQRRRADRPDAAAAEAARSLGVLRVVLGEGKRWPLFASAIIVAAVALLGLTVFTSDKLSTVGPLLAIGVVLVVWHQTLFRWRALMTLILLVILFIPIKRYSLPASLPINLEPYRLVVFFVAVGWITSLLIDPRVRFRKTAIDGPLILFAFIALISDIFNKTRVNSVQSEVVKKLLFFLSFFIVFYLTVSVVKRARDIDFVLRVLVGGGAVLGFLAIVERNTGFDLFNHLQSVFPFLHLDSLNVPRLPPRGGRLRVYASAQHPIALGAALTLLVPFAIYLTRQNGKRWWWWTAAALLTLGSMTTGSRTSVTMFLAMGLIYVLWRPKVVRRFWPALIPALLAIHFAAPGALGTVRSSFFPKGGIVAQQQNAAVGHGRLATLGPALRTEFDPNPLVGEGFGTRVSTPLPTVPQNGPILDDQWLGILLETGVAGTFALLWVFVRLIRRLWPHARDDNSPWGWLMIAGIASVASFAVSMFFYDAFSFIQVTFLLFILMGLSASALIAPEYVRTTAQATRREARTAATPPVGGPQGQPG